jgi:hypothetical protein
MVFRIPENCIPGVFTGDMTFKRLQQLESSAETDETKLNLPKYYCDKLL